MRIEGIELHHIVMPLVHPFETSFGRTDVRPCILVAVHSQGLTGWGECPVEAAPYYSYETIETAWHTLRVRDVLLPALVGQSVEQPGDALASAARVACAVTRWRALRWRTPSGTCWRAPKARRCAACWADSASMRRWASVWASSRRWTSCSTGWPATSSRAIDG